MNCSRSRIIVMALDPESFARVPSGQRSPEPPQWVAGNSSRERLTAWLSSLLLASFLHREVQGEAQSLSLHLKSLLTAIPVLVLEGIRAQLLLSG